MLFVLPWVQGRDGAVSSLGTRRVCYGISVMDVCKLVLKVQDGKDRLFDASKRGISVEFYP